jgi:replicative DNA helicase
MDQESIKTPYNIEAEEALLGSIFIKPDVLSELMEVVNANDFYKNNYKLIFSEMIEIYKTTTIIDSLVLLNSLRKKGILDEVGGEQIIYDLTDVVPTAANARTYAQIVRDNSIQRKLIDTGTKITEMAYRGYDDIDSMLDKAESMIFKIAEAKEKKDIISLKDLADMKLKAMEGQPKGKLITGIPSGYTDYDTLTKGFHGSDLVILAARPAMGKTAFSLNLALNVAKQGKGVLVFSLEMGNEQLFDRLLATETKIPLSKIKDGNFKEDEWAQYASGMGRLADLPLYISDSSSVNILEIKAISRRLKAEGKLDMIFIDYLQLISSTEGSRKSREQEISEISRSLKVIAKELNVPVLTLSQLSRAVESRSDKRPMLSDLRESGAIEQDADMVMFLYRDDYYQAMSSTHGQDNQNGHNQNEQQQYAPPVPNNNPVKVVEVIVGKHRNGPTGTVKLGFRLEYQQFINIIVNENNYPR